MTPPPSQEIVLDGPGISRALERMAHGIVARFPGEPLAIVGLLSQGDVIARRLVDKVKELGVEAQYGAIDISLYRDDIFKLEARPSLRSSNLPFSTDDMRVVLVDDVVTTGATLSQCAALLRQAQNKPAAFADFVALRDKINEVCLHTY